MVAPNKVKEDASSWHASEGVRTTPPVHKERLKGCGWLRNEQTQSGDSRRGHVCPIVSGITVFLDATIANQFQDQRSWQKFFRDGIRNNQVIPGVWRVHHENAARGQNPG